MPSGALAKKMLSAYTEIESWKLDRDIAMDHLDMEETIAWGNRLFQGLSESEAIWHAHVLEGKIDFQKRPNGHITTPRLRPAARIRRGGASSGE